MSYINEQNLTEFDKNIKEYIDNKLLLDKERFAYGIEWDITVSDPHCTRIGNPELHRTLPLQSSMKGCLLADDGTVNEYLPEDDWSNSVLDGSKGQVMVELPDMYVKFESEGNKRRAWMSTMPKQDFIYGKNVMFQLMKLLFREALINYVLYVIQTLIIGEEIIQLSGMVLIEVYWVDQYQI